MCLCLNPDPCINIKNIQFSIAFVLDHFWLLNDTAMVEVSSLRPDLLIFGFQTSHINAIFHPHQHAWVTNTHLIVFLIPLRIKFA